jgi:hypothetical protein
MQNNIRDKVHGNGVRSIHSDPREGPIEVILTREYLIHGNTANVCEIGSLAKERETPPTQGVPNPLTNNEMKPEMGWPQPLG